MISRNRTSGWSGRQSAGHSLSVRRRRTRRRRRRRPVDRVSFRFTEFFFLFSFTEFLLVTAVTRRNDQSQSTVAQRSRPLQPKGQKKRRPITIDGGPKVTPPSAKNKKKQKRNRAIALNKKKNQNDGKRPQTFVLTPVHGRHYFSISRSWPVLSLTLFCFFSLLLSFSPFAIGFFSLSNVLWALTEFYLVLPSFT